MTGLESDVTRSVGRWSPSIGICQTTPFHPLSAVNLPSALAGSDQFEIHPGSEYFAKKREVGMGMTKRQGGIPAAGETKRKKMGGVRGGDSPPALVRTWHGQFLS